MLDCLEQLSIAQNYIKLKSRARKRMLKDVGLGISLKNSLRSKEFITLLNNLGHCISYDEILRIDTEWAKTLLEKYDSYTEVIKNTTSGYFTQTAANNAHNVQESDSQHVTNTVLYQHGCFIIINFNDLFQFGL